MPCGKSRSTRRFFRNSSQATSHHLAIRLAFPLRKNGKSVAAPKLMIWLLGSALLPLFAVAGLAYAVYRRDLAMARGRVLSGSRILQTGCGPIEYGTLGTGSPVLVLHGTSGGWDQGVASARRLAALGFQLIAPSRFGYLRTALPADPSPEAEADAWALLLDALEIQRLPVIAFSAAAAPAVQLALRHPNRVSALVLIVPGAGGLCPEPAIAPPRTLLDVVYRFDFAMWVTMRLAPKIMHHLVAVPRSLVATLPTVDNARLAEAVRMILPVTWRRLGVLNDGKTQESAHGYPLERIRTPTLLISAADDLYKTLRQVDTFSWGMRTKSGLRWPRSSSTPATRSTPPRKGRCVMASQKRLLVSVSLICGVLSSLLYVAMSIVVAMQWESYSSASQTVSELSAIGAPTRSLWVVAAVFYTALVTVFGWGVWKSAGRIRALRTVGGLILAYGSLGLLWPFAPMHLREVLAAGGSTLSDTMHIVLASVTVVLMLLAIAFGAGAFGARFRLYSIATIVILVSFGILTFLDAPRVATNLPTPWIGVWERINVGAFLLWVMVLATTLLRAPDTAASDDSCREARPVKPLAAPSRSPGGEAAA